LIAREREAAAFEMRKRGVAYAQIGKALKVTPQGAHAMVTRTLKRIEARLTESVETVRAIEVQRLDSLLFALWPEAQRGVVRAVEGVLRIMERRAKLLGLDAPAKLMLSQEEMNEFTAFKNKMKHDADLRGTFDLFLSQVKGDASTEDLVCVLDNFMRVLSEMGQEEELTNQKLLEGPIVDVKTTKH
jgi:hypothetical protein